jgi:hypothetical protein
MDKHLVNDLKKIRQKFCDAVNKLEFNTEFRTKCDSFLIAYDQLLDIFQKNIKQN